MTRKQILTRESDCLPDPGPSVLMRTHGTPAKEGAFDPAKSRYIDDMLKKMRQKRDAANRSTI